MRFQISIYGPEFLFMTSLEKVGQPGRPKGQIMSEKRPSNLQTLLPGQGVCVLVGGPVCNWIFLANQLAC